MAGAEMVFLAGPPHLTHDFSGGSVIFWMTSKTAPQIEHLYSYNGIVSPHSEVPNYTKVLRLYKII